MYLGLRYETGRDGLCLCGVGFVAMKYATATFFHTMLYLLIVRGGKGCQSDLGFSRGLG